MENADKIKDVCFFWVNRRNKTTYYAFIDFF